MTRAADARVALATRERESSLDGQALRSIQEPLKQRYREDAGAAVVLLRASGELGEGVTCSVQTGRELVRAGLHPASGGDGLSACSGDMLLQALVACAGDVSGSVHAEGELDFRGTLSVDREAAVGFRAIRLRFELASDASDEQLATLLRLTERYCVVFQTLASPPSLSVSAD